MRRIIFLMFAGAPLLRVMPARAQNDADPATNSTRPALRVLLGSGDASPISQEDFTFQGRAYRGTFTRLDDGQVVNIVDLEEYLWSVVPAEMSATWPAAALQAQAICARTYVLQRSDPRRAYDLVPSELDQVYRGVQGEGAGTTAAVNATTGRVLRFSGVFAHVAFSSCCGGRTEAASDAWGSLPIPYLAGVDCTTCTASPNYRWSTSLTFAAIGGPFAASLVPFGMLEDIQISGRDGSGRVRAFELRAHDGSVVVKGGVFRRELGSRILRSLLIASLQRSPDAQSVMFDGGGLGHGVGLCQWGARGMALAGAGAPEILSHYFPGTAVANLD